MQNHVHLDTVVVVPEAFIPISLGALLGSQADTKCPYLSIGVCLDARMHASEYSSEVSAGQGHSFAFEISNPSFTGRKLKLGCEGKYLCELI